MDSMTVRGAPGTTSATGRRAWRCVCGSGRSICRRAETTAFDAEIRDLIGAACRDLGIAGVTTDTFDASTPYEVGDRVVHDGDYFVCTTAAPEGGAWNASNWETDYLINRAVCTYCKMHFGETDEFDNLRDSYDQQKAQLQMSSPYTNYDAYGIKGALGV